MERSESVFKEGIKLVKKVTQKQLDKFNELCNLPIKVSYANTENLQSTEDEVPLGYYFIVKTLRDMKKKQLKNLLYDVGYKAVLKISVVSTGIAVDTLTNDNFGKLNSPWRVILA